MIPLSSSCVKLTGSVASDVPSFSALTLLVGSLTRKTVPYMTYNVFGGTLNLVQSINRERRDPCFGHCVTSVACVGLITEIALYCRSGARSGATRKSGGAVSGRCRKTMEQSGARSGGSRSGNGAGSVGYRIRLERGAAFSPAPLRSTHMLW